MKKDILMNQYHNKNPKRAKVLFSKKIANILVRHDLSTLTVNFEPVGINKDEINELFGSKEVRNLCCTNKTIKGLPKDSVIQPRLFQIIEDSQDYHLCIVGKSTTDVNHMLEDKQLME